MNDYITRGYGIRIEDILSFKNDAFLNLLEKYDFLKDIIELPEDYDNIDVRTAVEEFVNEYEVEGLPAIINCIIEEKYGINTKAIISYTGYSYVIMPSLFPWEYNEKTNIVSNEEIDEIFKTILGILTEDVIAIKIYYIEE